MASFSFCFDSLLCTLGITSLGVQKYVAKIGCGNEPSLTLFHKLGFTEVWFVLSI